MELLKYKIFTPSAIPHDKTNIIIVKNEVGEDFEVVISELKDINTNKAQKHISVMERVLIKKGTNYEYSLKSSDVYGVVTLKELNAITVLQTFSRSYGQQNASIELVPVHYESEVSLVLNEESKCYFILS